MHMRREPYRLFFPLGIALAWAGVAHWLLHALGILEDFRPIFHAMTQIQGFLTAFAVGFLFTMIPRRTESEPPAVWQLAVGAIAPIATSVCAWFELYALSQLFWIALLTMMLGFIFTRFRAAKAKRRPPNSFVWIPTAFIVGIVGSVLTGLGAALGSSTWWLHDLGRGLVLQGVFLALIAGVSGLAIPLMTRGEPPADSTSNRRDRWVRALHLLGAIALIASFVIEQRVSLSAALLLRFAIITAVLLFGAELHRLPRGPGLNRWLIWSSAVFVPLGYLLAGIFDTHARGLLHVSFIGGFALLTLSVSTQVTLAHGGFRDLLASRPLRLYALGGAVLLALAPRVLMEVDPDRYFVWMGTAAAFFLAATLAWMSMVARSLRI